MSQSPYHIFYTDDDFDDQALFMEVVKSINPDHQLYSQYHGGELMDKLKQPPPKPDLIFLDLNMPHKNGFETLKEMRAESEFSSIPVIIFSTSNIESSIEKCKDLGANMYICKPPSFPRMKSLIGEVLSIDWKNKKGDDFQFQIC